MNYHTQIEEFEGLEMEWREDGLPIDESHQ